MKKLFIISLSAFCFVSLPVAFAGTLNFSGSVAEPACIGDVKAKKASVKCIRNGKALQQRYIGNHDLRKTPYNLGYVKIKTNFDRLDMIITYN